MSELFDIACNFSSNRYDNDLDEVIKNAKNNNVTKFLVVSASINDVGKVYSIYQKYRSDCFFTVGTHPHHANEINSESMKKMRILVKDLKPCSVGETGLDFFRNLSTLEEQIFAFEEQIKISIENDKPLFLHQRNSHDDFIKILRKYSQDINKSVVHCFTGTHLQLEDYLELGCYIGVTGWICDEKRNIELRKTIKDIPLSKLMIETDCPYLVPKNLPNKPKNNRNEPINLNHIVTEIAKLMEIDEGILRENTYKNSIDFFKT